MQCYASATQSANKIIIQSLRWLTENWVCWCPNIGDLYHKCSTKQCPMLKEPTVYLTIWLWLASYMGGPILGHFSYGPSSIFQDKEDTLIFLTSHFDIFFSKFFLSSSKTGASLLHNTCFGIGVQLLSRFESQEIGLQWSNIRDSPSVDDVFTMSTVFGMFICDTVLYLLVTW